MTKRIFLFTLLILCMSSTSWAASGDRVIEGITADQVDSLIFDTSIPAAGTTLSGTTLAVDGTDTNIDISVTPKGTGVLSTTSITASGDLDVDGTANLDDTDIDGTVSIQSSVDSTTAVQILDADGAVVGNFDTTNKRFGIGTATPTNALSLGANLAVMGSDTADASDNEEIVISATGGYGANRGAYIRLSGNEDSNTGRLLLRGGGVTGSNLDFSAAITGATQMLLDETGNLGIGTTAPQSLLDVQGAAGTAGIVTLSTAETTIVAGDETGRLNFNAPLEESGGDAILPGASIWAEAEGTYSATNNATSLVFATGASEAATEKMTLTSGGNLSVTGNITAANLAGILAYGVTWDEDESSPTLTRTGALASFAAAASPGDAALSIQAAMRRCILTDAGAVVYYLCETDSTKKEDCSTASVLDGTDGQVMVEIQKFAYKYSYVAATHVHGWSISSVLLPGYKWHPAFYKDGAWVDYRYFGAYEGSMYDATAAAMATDATAITAIYAAGDKLCSITGQCPKTNETRAEFRAMASERGAGWRNQDYFLACAVQLLYLVEYADFNSQTTIGMGRTELTLGTWVVDSYIGRTGKSNGDGNATANTGGDTNDAYMTYRGIENFYGNIWKWIDGININDNIPYACNNEANYADDTTSNYTRLVDIAGVDVTLHNANDYPATIEQLQAGFLAASGGASSSTKLCDYYYQAAGWRVVIFGGYAYSALRTGAFCIYANYASSDAFAYIGGRLCF